MSELKKREEFTRYDSMTTEELQELLRKHAHGELKTEPDTQELFKIMEVLSVRRQNTDSPAFRSDDDAFAEFCEHYMPKEKEAAPKKIIGFRKRILQPAAAVLAVVLVFTAGTILTAKAFNIDISSKFAFWTSDRFQFVDRTQETTASTDLELNSLQEALQHQNITERLAPNWLPEGYVHKEVKIKNAPKIRVVHETLVKNDAELVIIIRKMIGSPPMKVEKDDSLVEIYTVDGIDYYIFSNNASLQTKWCVDEFECTIAGSITLAEMKKMIDSI